MSDRRSVRPVVRDALRTATGAAHRQLEARPSFRALLAGDATAPEYAQVLQGLWRFHVAAEEILAHGHAGLCAAGMAYPPRAGREHLEADLRALAALPQERPAPCRSVPVAEAIGWAWVVEGSALGGQVIDAALERLFGAERRGRNYFTPAPDAGPRWREVCATIESFADDDGAVASLVAGARAAFSTLDQHLQ